MATSAATLSLIIDELVKTKPANRDAAIEILAAKGYLPKKLSEKPKEKKTSRFASKAAEDFAEAKGIVVPEGFKGTANGDKISVKDLKQLAEGPKKTKVNASSSAQQFCRDNGLDLTKVKGTGTAARFTQGWESQANREARIRWRHLENQGLKLCCKAHEAVRDRREDIVDIEHWQKRNYCGKGPQGPHRRDQAEKSDESSDESDESGDED